MDLLEQLPPYLVIDQRRCYLTVASWDGGWQASYLSTDGYAVYNYHSLGRSPAEAVLNLKEVIDLNQLLLAPAGEVES